MNVCEASLSHHTLYMGNLVPMYTCITLPHWRKKHITAPILKLTDDQKSDFFSFGLKPFERFFKDKKYLPVTCSGCGKIKKHIKLSTITEGSRLLIQFEHTRLPTITEGSRLLIQFEHTRLPTITEGSRLLIQFEHTRLPTITEGSRLLIQFEHTRLPTITEGSRLLIQFEHTRLPTITEGSRLLIQFEHMRLQCTTVSTTH